MFYFHPKANWGAPSELEMFWTVDLGLRSPDSLQPRLVYGGPSGLPELGKSRTTARTNSDGKLQGGRFCQVPGWFFTDFQLLPLISTWFRSFDYKNIFGGANYPSVRGWLENPKKP
jgi:hypothetical protein